VKHLNSFVAQGAINSAMKRDNNPTTQNTVRHFQQLCQSHRSECLKKMAAFESEKANILETWAPKRAESKIFDLRINLEGDIAISKAELEQELSAMIEGKRAQFKRIALSAPSDEQLRLLQTIALRADDLNPAEIAGIADNFADCHQAMRALASLAKKSGITVVVPDSAESFEMSIDEVHERLHRLIDEIDTPNDQLGYVETDFFLYPDSVSGPTFVMCEELDGKPYTVEQIDQRKTALSALAEAAAIAEADGEQERAEEIRALIVGHSVDNDSE
jgi:hypothetical protein